MRQNLSKMFVGLTSIYYKFISSRLGNGKREKVCAKRGISRFENGWLDTSDVKVTFDLSLASLASFTSFELPVVWVPVLVPGAELLSFCGDCILSAAFAFVLVGLYEKKIKFNNLYWQL